MPNDLQGKLLAQLGVDDPRYSEAENDAAQAEADQPMLHESPLFQEAVQVFIEQTGAEPATDNDFEGPGGVLDIMMQLRDGSAEAPAEQASQMLLELMGEGSSAGSMRRDAS